MLRDLERWGKKGTQKHARILSSCRKQGKIVFLRRLYFLQYRLTSIKGGLVE